jgi:hypothetical protein
VVVGEGGEELFDLWRGKAADITLGIDVARRGTNEDKAFEHARRPDRGEHSDHRADGVADENAALYAKLLSDLDEVLGITVKGCVLLRIIGRKIGSAGAHVIVKNREIVGLKRRCNKAPHVLIAAKAVSKDHWFDPGSGADNVISRDDGHSVSN